MSKWISRHDRLPPRHEDFIALNRDGRIFKSRMCYGMHAPWFTFPEGDKSPSDTLPDWLDVTHWIPMPDAPSEDSYSCGHSFPNDHAKHRKFDLPCPDCYFAEHGGSND